MMLRTLRHSLRTYTTQLVIGLLILVLITSLGTSIPVYWLTRTQLDHQVAGHLLDAERSTHSLLATEAQRLSNLTLLLTARPTFNRLAASPDLAPLAAYSRDFQKQIEIDLLLICTEAGSLLVGVPPLPASTPCPKAAGLVQVQNRPALIAQRQVDAPGRPERRWVVSLGVWLDNAMLAQLAAGTGVEQALIGSEGTRLAASLAPLSARSAASPASGRAAVQKSDGLELITVEGRYFYRHISPLAATTAGDPVALELLLPADDLIAARRRILWIILATSGLVAVVAALLGAWAIRRITAPLKRLTARAERIAQGDLNVSITALAGPLEVQTLSTALQRGQMRVISTLRELATARDRLDNLLQSLVEGVVIIDEAGVIRFWNQGAVLITGWPAGAAIGHHLDRVLPLVEPKQPSLLESLPLPGQRSRCTVLISGGSATVLEVTSVRAPAPDPRTGRRAERALVLRDVTEEEAMNHLRAYFLANISHEFRTPLSTLAASIELLMDEENHVSATEMRSLLNPIHLSLLELQTLIENLLASSTIEAGLFRLRLRPVQLNEAITSALILVHPMLERRGQTLSLTEPVSMTAIHADPTRLTQVLVNLLVNASKYAPTASPIDLTVEPEPTGGYRVAVADRGPGIPLQERHNLFRRFVRLDRAAEGTSLRHPSDMHGTGIGLYVVKTIVEAHGGRVGIEENPGGGSVFWFSLPPTPA